MTRDRSPAGRNRAVVLLQTVLLLPALLLPARAAAQHAVVPARVEPRRAYVAYRAHEPLTIDGALTERTWQAAPWTADFVDIEGALRPAPRLRTRAKLVWDDEYLYIAAELEQSHVWGTLTRRDAVIFHDDDFEVFIDPDGDTHAYYELEINALNTVWDLLLTMPYRDGGHAIDAWDIAGLRHAVRVNGTPNDAHDVDNGWTVELALPWSVLRQAAAGHRAPRAGEQWRINFSRVDWDMDVVNGSYAKRPDPQTGRPLAEHNWVWSPQGAINMHMPERWGTVQFSSVRAGEGIEMPRPDADERVRDALWSIYYAQRAHREAHGRFADTLDALRIDTRGVRVTLRATETLYEASASASQGGTMHIRHDGRLWREEGR